MTRPWAVKWPESLRYQWDHETPSSDDTQVFLPIEGATKPDLPVTAELAGEKLLCSLTTSSPGGTVVMHTDPA